MIWTFWFIKYKIKNSHIAKRKNIQNQLPHIKKQYANFYLQLDVCVFLTLWQKVMAWMASDRRRDAKLKYLQPGGFIWAGWYTLWTHPALNRQTQSWRADGREQVRGYETPERASPTLNSTTSQITMASNDICARKACCWCRKKFLGKTF